MGTKAIFSTSYLPPIDYFSALSKFSSIEIEQWENFQKQTIRNRCHILSANGIQALRIPVMHERKIKILAKDLKICYDEPWQRIHWSAIQSAYNKSPFFEFYKDDFEKIIFSKKIFLLDLNTELLELILKIIGIEIKICFTGTFKKNYPGNDFRFLSNNKSTSNLPDKNPRYIPDTSGQAGAGRDSASLRKPQYPQTFSYKFGFIPNLSIVDLIFNKGKTSIDCL